MEFEASDTDARTEALRLYRTDEHSRKRMSLRTNLAHGDGLVGYRGLEEFENTVNSWIGKSRHPALNHPYTPSQWVRCALSSTTT